MKMLFGMMARLLGMMARLLGMMARLLGMMARLLGMMARLLCSVDISQAARAYSYPRLADVPLLSIRLPSLRSVY